MTMRSKLDRFFIQFILISIIIIGDVLFMPLFFIDIQGELYTVLILTVIFLVLTSFILWVSFSVKYVFNHDYLIVKAGPFRSRIPYEKITKVTDTKAIFTGYRVLSSRDAIEIFYKHAVFGSVKVSPKNKEELVAELQKRNPKLQIH